MGPRRPFRRMRWSMSWGIVGAAFVFAGKELFEVRFDVVGGGDGG